MELRGGRVDMRIVPVQRCRCFREFWLLGGVGHSVGRSLVSAQLCARADSFHFFKFFFHCLVIFLKWFVHMFISLFVCSFDICVFINLFV